MNEKYRIEHQPAGLLCGYHVINIDTGDSVFCSESLADIKAWLELTEKGYKV